MLAMDYDQYKVLYDATLARMDPKQVWNELHEMAGGREPVLLCFERPPLVVPDNWCHRRMVADWFERELGDVVEEYCEPRLL